MALLLSCKSQSKCKEAAKTKAIWKNTHTWHWSLRGNREGKNLGGVSKEFFVNFGFFFTLE